MCTTAKQYLRGYLDDLHEMRALELDRIAIETKMQKVTRSIQQVNVKSSTSIDLSELMCVKIALDKKIADKLKMIYDKWMNIEEYIETLEPVERELIRNRYIRGKKWEEVCVAIGYSWRQTHRLHAEILKKLNDGTQWHTIL